MKRTLTHQRTSLAGALFLVMFAVLFAPPAHAQNDGRMRILVSNLEGEGNNGERIANRVKEQIDKLSTHVSVQRDHYRDAIRAAGLQENQMDCIRNRQLAIRMGVPLVLCGTFQRLQGNNLEVSAEVIAAQTGETYRIGPFQAPGNNEAGDQIVEQFAQYVEYLSSLNACNTYLESGAYDNALTNCNRALEINPGAESALMLRARVYYDMENFQQAFQEFRAVTEQNPVNQDALLFAGLAATNLGQADVGMEYFRKYLELDPGNTAVRLAVAQDVNQAGNPAGAMEIAEAGITADGEPDLTLLEYTGHYALNAALQIQSTAVNGEAAAATPYLEKALHYYGLVFDARGGEADPLMLRRMVQVLSMLERHDEAAELGGRAVAAVTDDAELWSVYADALQRGGRVEEALNALERVRELNPEAQRIAFRRANLLLQSDQLERAVPEFRTAIERGEVSADDVSNTIFAYGYQQKYSPYNGQPAQQRESIPYFQAAYDLAQSPARRGAPAFFLGFMEYQRGNGIYDAGNNSLAAAQQSLPIFQNALRLLNESQAWVAEQPSMQGSLQQVVGAVNTLIEIQEAIIQRGR
ncbi:MAG TPA: tetratricopeptide repeat protein [Longimicrobiales bacterium]|nr:tetratricopeptide repeat protein [Longimicrobiales bacterium]